jgi:hypothetical protein
MLHPKNRCVLTGIQAAVINPTLTQY